MKKKLIEKSKKLNFMMSVELILTFHYHMLHFLVDSVDLHSQVAQSLL